jgi:DNA repair exonuclease SbcCD ATPase subunit
MAPFIDGFGPTKHEQAVAARCDKRIAAIEANLAKLHDKLSRVDSAKKKATWNVEAEMLQSELEFWRAKRARVSGTSRHEGRDGYWLVPRRPSQRALRRANGLTDLADISSSPHDMASTLDEIALAVRIVIEEDGIPVMGDQHAQKAVDEIDVDARLEAAKETLFELDNTRAEMVKLAARYLELREGVEGRKTETKETASLMERELKLDRIHRVGVMDGPLAPSVKAWRKLMAEA